MDTGPRRPAKEGERCCSKRGGCRARGPGDAGDPVGTGGRGAGGSGRYRVWHSRGPERGRAAAVAVLLWHRGCVEVRRGGGVEGAWRGLDSPLPTLPSRAGRAVCWGPWSGAASQAAPRGPPAPWAPPTPVAAPCEATPARTSPRVRRTRVTRYALDGLLTVDRALTPLVQHPLFPQAWASSFDLSAARNEAAALLEDSPEILNAFHSLGAWSQYRATVPSPRRLAVDPVPCCSPGPRASGRILAALLLAGGASERGGGSQGQDSGHAAA